MTGPRWVQPGEPTCDALVEGAVASFHCVLVARHDLAPPEDPEPCVAHEVPSSLRAWRVWRERQDRPLVVADPTPAVDCPAGSPALDPDRPVDGLVERVQESIQSWPLVQRLRDRDELVMVARRAIESSWEHPAKAAVDGLLAYLLEGRR